MKHNRISEKYQKWIIQFHSPRLVNSVFFIWLRDTSSKNEPDQILINNSNEILVATNIKQLLKRVIVSELKLPDSKKMKKWLKESLEFKKISSIKYDLQEVEKKILSEALEENDIENIINFINIYEDYKTQIEEQKLRTKRINKIWNYYYTQIFFPNFNRTNQKKFTPKKLKINRIKLHQEFTKILKEFESQFKFIKKKRQIE